MIIDLRRAVSRREVSGARPKVERRGGPAELLKSRFLRLGSLGIAVLVIGLAASTLLFDKGTSASLVDREREVAKVNAAHAPAVTDLASYAFLMPELEGLPPTISPGTEIEIWATWEPPVTKRPKVQRLVPRAIVGKVIPSIEPGPPTVVLEVERRFLPDIMFGDRFGALSVVLASNAD
jgi:hypothetical protein